MQSQDASTNQGEQAPELPIEGEVQDRGGAEKRKDRLGGRKGPINWNAWLAFLLIVSAFVMFKSQRVADPFWWDEMGVYGNASFYMVDNGISLMPKDIPPDLGRGHPLLYVFTNATVMKIFGASVETAHWFNLFIAVCVLFSMFFVGRKLLNDEVAVVGTLVLAVQGLFIAQAHFLLPEMMLCLFALWAFYFFLKKRWWAYFLFASLAVLTKETGGIIPFVLVMVMVISKFVNGKRLTPKALALVLSPVLVFVGFLVLQKQQMGWYMFPYHNPEQFLNPEHIAKQSRAALKFIFFSQGRFLLSSMFLLGFVFLLINWKRYRRTNLMLFNILVCSFLFGFLVFSSINHWMGRYALMVFPLLVLLTIVLVSEILAEQLWLRMLCYAALVGTALMFLYPSSFNHDEDYGYLPHLEMSQQMARFVEFDAGSAEVLLGGDYFGRMPLIDYRHGYVSKNFATEAKELGPEHDYLLFPFPGSHDVAVPDSGWRLVAEFREAEFWGEVYVPVD